MKTDTQEQWWEEYVYDPEKLHYIIPNYKIERFKNEITKLQKENKELLEIIETLNKVRDNLQDTHTELLRQKVELVELLKIIKIVHYDNLPMYHSEWSELDNGIENKIKRILGENKPLQTSEDHVQ